ncbi:Pept-C1 domain-containing protein [Aphelenchoides besseyi]|nr:Pept-C1 domain-containing protein [Aphelenchoides besseyi]
MSQCNTWTLVFFFVLLDYWIRAQPTNGPMSKDLLTVTSRSSLLGSDGKPKPLISPAFVNLINSKKNKLFVARRYERFENLTRTELTKFLGTSIKIPSHRIKRGVTSVSPAPDTSKIPTSFDVRDKWPQCSSVFNRVAVATTSVISDRRCIRSNGTATLPLSAWDVISCCSQCRADDTNGCNGGWPTEVFQWYDEIGIVTGDDYLGKGCKPYSVSPSATSPPNSTECSRTCQKKYTTAKYARDKKKGQSYREFNQQNAAVQMEIMTNGPVVAIFSVYDDFFQYSGGCYQHIISGTSTGSHAVRIVGWGVENDVKFWLAINSWSSSWGENGFFKIRRDTNECDFESQISSNFHRQTTTT